MPRITITTFELKAVERQLCVEALNAAGTIVDAASLLGITRHALKKRIIKHDIAWPPRNLDREVVRVSGRSPFSLADMYRMGKEAEKHLLRLEDVVNHAVASNLSPAHAVASLLEKT